jgi:hypothetical protein
MKKTMFLFFLVISALLMASCAPATPVTTIKVTASFSNHQPSYNPMALFGGKYTEMNTGDGFILESADGMGVYDGDWDPKAAGEAQGPYRKIVFRTISPDLQITTEDIVTEITHLRPEYYTLRDVTLYYNDHVDNFGSATEPELTEKGIIFWTGRNDDPACEYVPSQDVPSNEYEGDRIAWHCVFNFSPDGNGLIAYLYKDGRP